VLGAGALLSAADEAAKSKLLPGIAAGKSIATLAVTEPTGKWDLGSIAMRATRADSEWKLSGVKDYVLDGHIADVLIVVAKADEGLGLFQVETGAAGLERNALPTLDLTRKMARLNFSGTPATRISAGDAAGALRRVMALAVTMLAAEQAGGAQR